MGSGVEAGGLEVDADVRKRVGRGHGQAETALLQEPVDVVGPEPDALHVEGCDGSSEGFALVDQLIAGVPGWLRLDEGDEVRDAGLCGRS